MNNFSWRVGLRYTRAKRRNHFISFISSVSILGIVIGVMVLITVLSVMNGFDKELKERILGYIPHVTVSTYEQSISEYDDLRQQLSTQDNVTSVRPYVQGQGLITFNGRNRFVNFEGIFPSDEYSNPIYSEQISDDALSTLEPRSYNMILGKRMADGLGVKVNDQVSLVLSDAALTPAGIVPRFKRFTVTGLVDIQEQGNYLALINIEDAARLLKLPSGSVSGLHLWVDDLYRAPLVNLALQNELGFPYTTWDWTRTHGSFFEAVKLEKTMMFLILTLIIAVAAFNMLSSLVMLVRDKQSDIAVLRTLGASPGDIMVIFILQGLIIGIFGIIAGIALGILLSLNVTEIVRFLETLFNIQLISGDVYYIDYLPAIIEWQDIMRVSIITFLLSFLSTIYPAYSASRVQPAEALRYE